MNRHVWQLVAALGVMLMAYARADDRLYAEVFDADLGAEVFAISAGALPAGLLFWRGPTADVQVTHVRLPANARFP